MTHNPHYNPELKEQSKLSIFSWRRCSEKRRKWCHLPVKSWLQFSEISIKKIHYLENKTMIIFTSLLGQLHCELITKWFHLTKILFSLPSWQTSAHTSAIVVANCWIAHPHPAYFLKLASCDLFLFTNIKNCSVEKDLHWTRRSSLKQMDGCCAEFKKLYFFKA